MSFEVETKQCSIDLRSSTEQGASGPIRQFSLSKSEKISVFPFQPGATSSSAQGDQKPPHRRSKRLFKGLQNKFVGWRANYSRKDEARNKEVGKGDNDSGTTYFNVLHDSPPTSPNGQAVSALFQKMFWSHSFPVLNRCPSEQHATLTSHMSIS